MSLSKLIFAAFICSALVLPIAKANRCAELMKGENMSLEIVLTQLEAYNRKNLDENFKYFADDLKVYLLPEGKVLFNNKTEARAHTERGIESGEFATSEVLGQMQSGSFVTLHEQKIKEGVPRTAIITYFVEDGLIKQMWIAPQ
ncbi:MAG: hypothetical protein H6621_00020 [Halobacteriovoraceae bacterium]|nr:hypothetical protein [Halobacteriovoraceae bacterium]